MQSRVIKRVTKVFATGAPKVLKVPLDSLKA